MKRYVSFLFLISICLCQGTEKYENSDNKELKQHLSNSGEHLTKYVDSYFINTGIAFLGYLAFDYGIKNPIKTFDSNDDRLDETTLHPAVFAGSLMITVSYIAQIFNVRKIKRAGEELTKAGDKI
ncbi:MAG: hypothetical protein ACJZ1R_02955 [Candidatus Neomarinimicrobiota bacterium]